MSYCRRTDNPGKREREARKRHRRAVCWFYKDGAEVGPLKLGRKHLRRRLRADLAVADSRNAGRGGGVMSPPAESPQQDV
jgi:hypothetical protein